MNSANESDRDRLLIDAFGPHSDLTARALPQIIPKLPRPLPALRPEAIRGVRKLYGNRFPPEAVVEALRAWFAAIVHEAGRRVAPRCDLLTGSGAEHLLDAWSDSPVQEELARRCNIFAQAAGDGFTDLFRGLYESIFPREVRHASGEHYTPAWLVELVLDRAGLTGAAPRRVVDPSCGSGAFLVRAARRLQQGGLDFLESVCGFDVNPLAVLAGRVNLLACLGDAARDVRTPPRVFLHDTILAPPPCGPFDLVVGNPPWVLWDNLPAEYRERTKALWKHYGLFNLSHREARLGGGKKDLAMLFTYAAADRLLDDGGTLAFVVSQAIVHSGRAGAGFRRFRIGRHGPHLRVVRFDDLSALAPFDAAVRAGVIVLQKGRPTNYPVPYGVWSETRGARRCEERLARPVTPGSPGAPWQIVDPTADRRHGSSASARESAYTARTGAFTGGANGVFWLEILREHGSTAEVRNLADAAKRGIEQRTAVIETDLIYPLLRWRDVGRWRATPRQHILLVQDPASRQPIPELLLHGEYPATHAYLKGLEAELRARGSSMIRSMMDRGAFYAMFGIGDYTMSPWKVVWRRMAKEFTAAVVGMAAVAGQAKPVLPQETLTFIPCTDPQEAHYLCALLNSPQATAWALAFTVPGGKSFGSAGMAAHMPLAKFDPRDAAHVELAELSQQAHENAAHGKAAAETSADIDRRLEMLVAKTGLF